MLKLTLFQTKIEMLIRTFASPFQVGNSVWYCLQLFSVNNNRERLFPIMFHTEGSAPCVTKCKVETIIINIKLIIIKSFDIKINVCFVSDIKN